MAFLNTSVNGDNIKQEKKEHNKNNVQMSRGEHTHQGQVYHKEIQIVDHVQPDIIEGTQTQNKIKIYKTERSLIIYVFKFNIISAIPSHSTSTDISKLLISTYTAKGISVIQLTQFTSKIYTHDNEPRGLIMCENVCACVNQTTSNKLQSVFLLYVSHQMALQGSSQIGLKY